MKERKGKMYIKVGVKVKTKFEIIIRPRLFLVGVFMVVAKEFFTF